MEYFLEGRVGDDLQFDDALKLTFLGTETNFSLAGQPTVAPALTAPGPGTGVWAYGLLARLDSLLYNSEEGVHYISERLRLTLLEQNLQNLYGGAQAACPYDILEQTNRLYHLGIPTHCLLFYCRWLTA